MQIQLEELLKAGFHFGHKVEKWNPKMKPYLYGSKNGVHIINLSKTANQLQDGLDFLKDRVADGQEVLFVGTKRQAHDIVMTEAERCKMHYINTRWLGGTLTNFTTIKASISRLKNLEKGREEGEFETLKKAERLKIDREITRLKVNLEGIKNLNNRPGVLVLVDPNKEHLALKEANRLGTPVLALVDSNCNPSGIDYVVPGNDDAIKSLTLFYQKVADTILEGLKLREVKARQIEKPAKEESKSEGATQQTREAEGVKAAAYVSTKNDLEDDIDESEVYSVNPESSEAKSIEVKSGESKTEEIKTEEIKKEEK